MKLVNMTKRLTDTESKLVAAAGDTGVGRSQVGVRGTDRHRREAARARCAPCGLSHECAAVSGVGSTKV